MNYNIMLGDIFFKKEGENTKIIRIIKKLSNSKFELVDDKYNSYILKDKELIESYTRLNPLGYITFSIVNMMESEDVVITLHRRKDLLKEDNIPFVICRQNIENLFATQIIVPNEDIHIVGLSINKDNCPKDVNYNTILACDGVKDSICISYYIEDTLDDILSFIDTDPFDTALYKTEKHLYDTSIYGYCKSIKELLNYNDFMFDVHYAFNIIEFDNITIVDENRLHPLQIEELEKIFSTDIVNTYVLKYDKSIDLDEIKRNHILATDHKDIYIIGYDKGTFSSRNYTKYIQDLRNRDIYVKMALGHNF